jgi:hypothetical protein
MPETFNAITIGAHDEGALSRRCEVLVARASKTSPDMSPTVDTFKDAREAMLALSYISDPVAIPCLVRSLNIPYVERDAFSALIKFSTPEALNALIAIVSRNGRLSTEAKETLHRKAPGIQDSTLRNQIYDALGEPRSR